MNSRHWLYVAGASVIATLTWYFWDDLRVIYQGGETETDDAETDTPEIEVTGPESNRMVLLLPQVQAALQATINDLGSQGISVFIGQTRRTKEQESINLAKGASATMHSWHLLGRAVDLYPIDPNTGDPDLNGRRFDLFKTMQQTGAKYGFTNISFYDDWTKRLITTSKGKIWDGGHMQFTEGKTWAQASSEQESS
jgi:hypothetical protein